MGKIKWRLVARNVETRVGQYVWADQPSKKKAIALAEAFNKLHDEIKWEVWRESWSGEGEHIKTRVF